MTTLQQAATSESTDAASDREARPTHVRFGRYLLLLFLIPAALYPWAFCIVRIPSYESWSTSQWGPMLEYAFDTQQQNADVVIFGDSTAFTGIDPKLVNARLGIKSIVLPDTVGSMPVTGDAPLRTYLAHNPPPRLIVFYFSAWNLDYRQESHGRLFEGEEMLLRHLSRREILHFTLEHPGEMLAFPFRLYSTFGPKIVAAALHHVNRERETAGSLGHADYTALFPPLRDDCTLAPEYLDKTGRATIDELIQRYQSPETRVMVYLAPIPACRKSSLVADRSYADVGAAPPKLLPPFEFAADPLYAHVRPPFVPTASDLFAEALRGRLQQPDLASRIQVR